MESMKVTLLVYYPYANMEDDYERQIFQIRSSNAPKAPESPIAGKATDNLTREQLVQMIKIAEKQNIDLQQQKKSLEEQVCFYRYSSLNAQINHFKKRTRDQLESEEAITALKQQLNEKDNQLRTLLRDQEKFKDSKILVDTLRGTTPT